MELSSGSRASRKVREKVPREGKVKWTVQGSRELSCNSANTQKPSIPSLSPQHPARRVQRTRLARNTVGCQKADRFCFSNLVRGSHCQSSLSPCRLRHDDLYFGDCEVMSRTKKHTANAELTDQAKTLCRIAWNKGIWIITSVTEPDLDQMYIL